MDNLRVEIEWIDGMNQCDLMLTFKVTASSRQSYATQECDYTTEMLKTLGNEMVEHSFRFEEERGFEVGVGIDSVLPMRITLHKANTSGRLPIEVVFQLEDDIVGRYSSTVVVWTELGQLESFGKRLANLPKKGVGASCELNAEVN